MTKTTDEYIDECAKRVMIAALKIAGKHRCCVRCVLEQLARRTAEGVEKGHLRHIGDDEPDEDSVSIIIVGTLQ